MVALSSLILPVTLALSAAAMPAAEKRQGSFFAWCSALRVTCGSQIQNADYSDFFAHDACLFGSTCPDDTPAPSGPKRNVQAFIDAVVNDKDYGATGPSSENLPRATNELIQSISTNAHFISQQNFIDGFYRALAKSNGPYPDNADPVIGYFNNIVDWTASCLSEIPLNNFADYFTYSSYVVSEDNCN
ncbi:hypothetical protein C8Q80DRAFT_1275637 [Daedaleopsis nitida]|nr:hypothetical protein C8Q80DRAFT_1275637 [Daedaleopsis nitida]